MKTLPRLFFLIYFFAFFLLGNSARSQIIPKPDHIVFKPGVCNFSKLFSIETKGFNAKDDHIEIGLLKDYLEKAGLKFTSGQIATKNLNKIFFEKQANHPDIKNEEGYILYIGTKNIRIIAKSGKGIFYGLQSLLQLAQTNADTHKVACMEIIDAPRFSYRGLHIDVSRHFFPVDFIKKQLDMMAYYKLNTFHWHLTDGPGWRLEIKKYPLLTQIAAWRTHEKWKDWWATNPRSYVDSKTSQTKFGGFYTQEEARSIVQYAAERQITVIPEIEMPGHSEEVLATYPHLSCYGKPYTSSEFCIGNDSAFTFLQDVLMEVMDIFPSKYIHIGGDEADMSHWKKCAKCQKRMKNENLKNEAELQSYLIKRIEKFLIHNGRKLIGWDEILEGGLSPNATVMSWRGEDGGIKAAQAGHDAIMTPGAYCYFDSYQANPSTQPEAIGGFLPLQKVYSYNPIPDSLTANEAKHILGVQANLWTEYISTPAHAEYMIYPRLTALAEVAWSMHAHKNWTDFKVRVNKQIPFLEKQGYNTFTLAKEPAIAYTVDTTKKEINVSLNAELYPAEIRYTLNGDTPSPKSKIYAQPIKIKKPTLLKAQMFNNNKAIGTIISENIGYHKAIGKRVIYNTPYSRYYTAGGNNALIDGYSGGISHADGKWQGFSVPNMDVSIDLGEIQNIRAVKTNFMQSPGAWIWLPKSVSILVSDNGKDFKEIIQISNQISSDKESANFQESYDWEGNIKARYVQIKASQSGKNGAWIFIDEIQVW